MRVSTSALWTIIICLLHPATDAFWFQMKSKEETVTVEEAPQQRHKPTQDYRILQQTAACDSLGMDHTASGTQLSVFVGGNYEGPLASAIEGSMVVLGDFSIGPNGAASLGVNGFSPDNLLLQVGGNLQGGKQDGSTESVVDGIIEYGGACLTSPQSSTQCGSWTTTGTGTFEQVDVTTLTSTWNQTLANLQDISDFWQTFNSNGIVTIRESGPNWDRVTLSSGDDSCIQVFDLPLEVWQSKADLVISESLHNKTILINVQPGTDGFVVIDNLITFNVMLETASMSRNLEPEDVLSHARQHMIWNFGSATTVRLGNGMGGLEFPGTIVVPYGDLDMQAWGVCGSVWVSGNVYHNASGSSFRLEPFEPTCALCAPEPTTRAPTSVPIDIGSGSSPAPTAMAPGPSPFENVTAGLDWGLRFNKFEVLDTAETVRTILPLNNVSYPLTVDHAQMLRAETSAISVNRPEDSLELTRYPHLTPRYLLEQSGVVLNHPSRDQLNPFWEELLEVIQAQLARLRGDPVSDWMRLPSTWQGFTLEDVAAAVRDEYPGSHHTLLLAELLGGALDRVYETNCPTCAQVDRNIIPSQSSVEFIRGMVMLSDLNTWAFGTIGPLNFNTKWEYGRARPEEVVWEILQGTYTEGVPAAIMEVLNQNFAGLPNATSFTAYPEGSPCHPSFPAMHAASSAASLWMPVVFDLTPLQHCRVKALDYAIAYARTIAGVHYPTDNIGGLNMGQEILSEILPDYLEEKYGSDRQAVIDKIAQVRFDWKDYLTDGVCDILDTAGGRLLEEDSFVSRKAPTKQSTRTVVRRMQEADAAPQDRSDFENVTATLDWGLRFNKFDVIDTTGSVATILPLTSDSYPLSIVDAWLIRDETSAISVNRPADSFELDNYPDLTPRNLLERSGIILNHPSRDPQSPFWSELLEVIHAQVARLRGDPVSDWMQLPSVWEGYNLDDVAAAVHDEYPGSHHANLLAGLLGGALDRVYETSCPTCAQVDRSIIRSLSSVEFIRGMVMLSDLNTWAFGAIGPLNFNTKWEFGRARPEEVVWEILQGTYTEGIPAAIMDILNTEFASLQNATSFTAYPEGSPCHPSFPAMHAASSAASLWMPVVMDLSMEQHCRVKALDYAIAYARTIAGVHYPSDNIGGLQMGQEILAQILPDYLEAKYGSDRQVVNAKIEQVRFDWNTYLTDGVCTGVISPPI